MTMTPPDNQTPPDKQPQASHPLHPDFGAIALHSRWLFFFAIAIIAIAACVFVSRSAGVGTPKVSLDDKAGMAACEATASSRMSLDHPDTFTLNQLSNYCYNDLRSAYVLGDFNLRRSAMVQQHFEGDVMLWMVVAITVSGVLLAGLQLAAAYNLSLLGKGEFTTSSGLTISNGQIALQSSVTGLMILAMSLAFFIVFVVWVYTIKETTTDVEASSPIVQTYSAPAPTPAVPGPGRQTPSAPSPAHVGANPALPVFVGPGKPAAAPPSATPNN